MIMETIEGILNRDGSSTVLMGVVGTTLSVLAASALWKHWEVLQKRELYDKWIAQARSERDAKVHKVLLKGQDHAAEEESVYCLSAVETNDLVRRGSLNARDNVLRVALRTRKYGRKLNAIAEELYDEAAEVAEKLHSAKNTTKDDVSPLYGVPLSVKECIGLKGTYSTGGLACRLRNRDLQDSVIVKVLRQQGALPICTGNAIQMMMLTESVNRIWGRTKNPWNLERSAGGSSGGDAALVAMGCVPLALASDVAGSIRVPACFCGVTGFKPTKRRISSAGNMKPRVHDRAGTSELIPLSLGPIARTVDDCVAFMKTILVPSLFEEDVNVAPMPFNESLYKSEDPKEKLRIAYYVSDGWFTPCRTSRRAVQETVEGLRKQGHECVELELPVGGFESYCLLVALNAGDGSFKAFLDALEGEQPVDEYKPIILASKLPDAMRWILVRLLDKRRSTLLQQTRASGLSVREYWEKTADLTDFKAKWAAAMKDFDAVVFPGMPIPALKHGTSGELTCTVSYMFTASLLDWPCGAVPVTTIRPEEACYPMDELPQVQQDHISRLVQQTMQGSAGLPIGVSVMTPAYQDEKCLRVMKEVESAVEFTATPEAYKAAL